MKGQGNLYFSSVGETAGREFVDYCKTWAAVFNAVARETAEDEVIDDQRITTKVLTFDNGTKIVVGSSNPRFFRSKGGDADADEFAFHQQGRELLKAMHATALVWNRQHSASGRRTTARGPTSTTRSPTPAPAGSRRPCIA